MVFRINDSLAVPAIVDIRIHETVISEEALEEYGCADANYTPTHGVFVDSRGREYEIVGIILVKLSFEMRFISKMICQEIIIVKDLDRDAPLIIGWSVVKRLFVDEPTYTQILFRVDELMENRETSDLRVLILAGMLVTSDDIEQSNIYLTFEPFFDRALCVTIINESSDMFVILYQNAEV